MRKSIKFKKIDTFNPNLYKYIYSQPTTTLPLGAGTSTIPEMIGKQIGQAIAQIKAGLPKDLGPQFEKWLKAINKGEYAEAEKTLKKLQGSQQLDIRQQKIIEKLNNQIKNIKSKNILDSTKGRLGKNPETKITRNVGENTKIAKFSKIFANVFKGSAGVTKELIKKALGTMMKVAGGAFTAASTYFLAKNMRNIVRGANKKLGNPWNEMTESYIIGTATSMIPLIAAARKDAIGAVSGLAGELVSATNEAYDTYLDPRGTVEQAKKSIKQTEKMQALLEQNKAQIQAYRTQINMLEQKLNASPAPQKMKQDIDNWKKAVYGLYNIYRKIGWKSNFPGYIALKNAHNAGYYSPWHLPSTQDRLRKAREKKGRLERATQQQATQQQATQQQATQQQATQQQATQQQATQQQAIQQQATQSQIGQSGMQRMTRTSSSPIKFKIKKNKFKPIY